MSAIATEEARRLLRIARADFAACLALIGAPGVRFANAAFHGQQAVEKALKAVLTVHLAEIGRSVAERYELGIDLPCRYADRSRRKMCESANRLAMHGGRG